MSVRVRKKLIDFKLLPTIISSSTRSSSKGLSSARSTNTSSSSKGLSSDKKASSTRLLSSDKKASSKGLSSDKKASSTRLLSSDKKASSKGLSSARLSSDNKALIPKVPSKNNTILKRIKMFFRKKIEEQVVLREQKREEQVVLREQKLEKQRVMREKKLKQENRKKLIVQLMRDESHTSQDLRDIDANNELTLRNLMSKPVDNDPYGFREIY